MERERESLDILLIEDNPGDVYLFKSALADIGKHANVLVFATGLAAIEHLRNITKRAAQKPDLIVLDLNLPAVNGREILKAISDVEFLCTIPVAVFSGSFGDRSIVGEFPTLHLTYSVKTADYDELQRIVARFLLHAGGGK